MIYEMMIDMLNTKIALVVGKKKAIKYVKKQYGIALELDSDGSCIEFTDDGKQDILVVLKKSDNIVGQKGLLVHEISHAVSFMMDWYNIRCDEFRSYAVQYLYSEMIREIDGMHSRRIEKEMM